MTDNGNENNNDVNPVEEVWVIAEAAEHHDVRPTTIRYMCEKYWQHTKPKQARAAGGKGTKRITWLINKSTVLAYKPDEIKKNR